MSNSFHRKPLPAHTTEFSSAEGRRIFAEALREGGLEGYFRLAEQFHTQAEPSYCGLGTLVTALNALGIDPQRTWKGPWRWFAEELLDCCVPLDQVRARGLSLDELACLARCNGAEVALHRADESDLASFRCAVERAAAGETVLIASYDRASLGQTGSGHFSPIGGHASARDLVLVLDVARFKYPPHWLSLPRLWEAMLPVDAATGRSRGFVELRAQLAMGHALGCERGALDAVAGEAVPILSNDSLPSRGWRGLQCASASPRAAAWARSDAPEVAPTGQTGPRASADRVASST